MTEWFNHGVVFWASLPGQPVSARRSDPVRAPPARVIPLCPSNKESVTMSIIDKITGKAKQAAGDVTDDPSLRRQGQNEQSKGEAKEKQADAERRADEESDRVDDLERRT